MLRVRSAGVSSAAWRAARLARNSEKKGTLACLGVGVEVGVELGVGVGVGAGAGVGVEVEG